MRIPRIYHPGTLSVGAEVVLPPTSSHHLLHVLRCQPGSVLVVFNGKGDEYSAALTALKGKQAVVHIESHQEPHVESPLSIHLGQGISRGERMDYVIQKAVELGVGTITPLFTERCEVRLKGERLERRLQHWQSIAVGACEQSGRVHIPKIHTPCSLNDWVSSRQGKQALCLVLDHRASRRLADVSTVDTPKDVSLLVGPEGGLDPTEIAMATEAAFESVRLGPRVLRTETVTVAALSVLQYRWGDL